jgi:hypothetical protein
MEIRAGTEEAGVTFAIFLGALLEEVDDFGLGHLARDGEIAGQAKLGGNGRKKIVDGARADGFEHGVAVGGGFGEISHKNLRLDVGELSNDCGVSGTGKRLLQKSEVRLQK